MSRERNFSIIIMQTALFGFVMVIGQSTTNWEYNQYLFDFYLIQVFFLAVSILYFTFSPSE